MKLIKRIYHIFLKRDVMSLLYTHRFAKFGNKSTLYKPLIISSHDSIYIGENTTILNGVRMQVYNKLSGLNSKIVIGNDCYIGYNNSFLAGGNIILEDGVLLASNILLSSENHSVDPTSELYYSTQRIVCKQIIIKEGTWIGEKVSIMPGVSIGKKCVIGAGSVVTKSVPDYCMAVGAPAKVIKKYDFSKNDWVKVD